MIFSRNNIDRIIAVGDKVLINPNYSIEVEKS
jgi:hypothetical protein